MVRVWRVVTPTPYSIIKAARSGAVDQHDAFFNQPYILLRITAKTGGGDKHPLARPVQIERSGERPGSRGRPTVFIAVALGLQVDGVEP